MFYLNDLIRRKSPLSLLKIKAELCFPNIYQATSIADFLEHKDEIEPTPDKFLALDPSLFGAALISFNNCYYEQNQEPLSREKLGTSWVAYLCLLTAGKELGILELNTPKQQEQLENMLARYHNATLYDSTGKVKVYSNECQIPDGTRLYRATVHYTPGLGLLRLGHFERYGPATRDRQTSPETLLDRMGGIIPELSPA